MASKNKLNDYDFISTGIAGGSASSDSVASEAAAHPNSVLKNFDKTNKFASVSHGDETINLANRFVYTYDFATDGGAIGAIALRGNALPADFVVENARYYVTDAFTSGGSATIALGTASGTPANLLAAAAIGTAGTAGLKQGIPDWGTVGDAIKVSATSAPTITVAVADLTKGSITLVLDGFVAAVDQTT